MTPVLLFDGQCALCSSVVQFVLRHERTDTLRFAALESPAAEGLLDNYQEIKDLDTVVWVDRDPTGAPSRVLIRSAAALRLARYLGGGWRWLAVFWIVPRPVRDFLYDVVARHRHKLLGGKRPPSFPEDVERRFLDGP